MTELTDYQIINDKSGKPAFVVIPYEDFKRFQEETADKTLTLPNEVVGKTVMEEMSLLRAWREYKGINETDMARKMGVPLSEYQSIEECKHLHETHLEAAADVLGIDARLLNDN